MARDNESGVLPACTNFTLTGNRQLSACLAEALDSSVSRLPARPSPPALLLACCAAACGCRLQSALRACRSG